MNSIKTFLKKVPGYKYLGYFKLKKFYNRSPYPIKVMSIEESIWKIKREKLCIIRFGDGEVEILSGIKLYFQSYNELLENRMRDIITHIHDKGLLLCFPDIFEDLSIYNIDISRYWYQHLISHKNEYINIINHDYLYGNSFISRPYIMFKNKNKCSIWFDELKSIWENKDITIIEGEKSRLGVGNDLFDKASSIERILCPSKNAFDKYEKILNESLKTDKNRLILVSLGPTAKVLVYDLYKAGYWAIDIGHIDSEYEWYLRGAKDKIKIKGKHTAENKFEDLDNIEDSEDKNYISQIRINICRR